MPKLQLKRPPFLLGLLLAVTTLGARSEAQSYPGVPASIEDTPPSNGRAQRADPNLNTVPEDIGNSPLTAGSLLRLEIYGAPDMSTDLRVATDGTIAVPFVGPLAVAGKTVMEAQAAIAQALTEGEILNNPQVTLIVEQYAMASVTVLGEVQSPGRVQLVGAKTLEDVLALAGGETLAAGNVIEVDHPGQAPSYVHYAQGGSPESLRKFTVQRGDSVFVRRAGVIYVLGAVNRPGGYLMVHQGQLNVLQAISVAQGTTLVAKSGTFYIIRSDDDGGYQRILVPYDKMAKGKMPPMALSTNDILYVPTSEVKTVLINGSSIIGVAASAAIYRAP